MNTKTLIAFLTGICFLFYTPIEAAAAATPSEAVFSMPDMGNMGEPIGRAEFSLSYGYQNSAKPGRFLPIRMTVSNNEGEALEGSIELYLVESSDMVYCYEYPVEVEAFGAQKISGNISVGENVEELLAVLKDESGSTISEKTVRLNIESSGPALFIGIISDDPTSLNFMSGVSLNNTSLKARTVFLNADELPDTQEGLDQLDVIVISNYNVNLLDSEVIGVIWEWVENGGTLLLGTGARHNPIGDFMDYLPETEIGRPEIKPVNMGIRYSSDGLNGAVLNIPVSDVYIEGGTQKISGDDTAILTTVKVGMGTVGIAAYDLCDISEFCKEQISYTDELLTALIGSSGIDRLSRLMDEERNEYEEISGLINEGNVESFPNLSLYLLAAVAYILLAGPGLYVFLKQRGLSIFYGPSVAGTAVIASILIWFMGTGTRMSGTFINFAAIKETGKEGETERDFIGLSSPYNSAALIEILPEYTVRPIISGERSVRNVRSAVNDGGLKHISIDYNGSSTYIETENMKPFSEALFELYRSGGTETESEIDTDLSIFDGRVDGSISNNGDSDLTDVSIIFGGTVLKVGDIPAGESRRITGEEMLTGPAGIPYIEGNYIMGLSEAGTSSGSADMQKIQRSGLIEYYMENSLGNSYEEAIVTGFSEGEEKPASLVSEGISSYGTTLIVKDAEARFEKDGEVYRLALREEPKLISGEYNMYDNTTGGNAAVVIEYSLGTDISVTGLKLNRLSEEMSGMSTRTGDLLQAFEGDISLYNYYTNSYDNMESGKTEFSGDELVYYLSPGNTITVRYIPTESTGGNTAVFLPLPSVTGERS